MDRVKGIDTMEVRVEINGAMPGLDEMKSLERIRGQVMRGIDTVLGITAKVTLVEPKGIARGGEGKARRVVDKRQI